MPGTLHSHDEDVGVDLPGEGALGDDTQHDEGASPARVIAPAADLGTADWLMAKQLKHTNSDATPTPRSSTAGCPACCHVAQRLSGAFDDELGSYGLGDLVDVGVVGGDDRVVASCCALDDGDVDDVVVFCAACEHTDGACLCSGERTARTGTADHRARYGLQPTPRTLIASLKPPLLREDVWVRIPPRAHIYQE